MACSKVSSGRSQTAPKPNRAGDRALFGPDQREERPENHGQNGEGIQAMNAPSLLHTNDWYLVSQLNKFKAGIRGANPIVWFGAEYRYPLRASRTDQLDMARA